MAVVIKDFEIGLDRPATVQLPGDAQILGVQPRRFGYVLQVQLDPEATTRPRRFELRPHQGWRGTFRLKDDSQVDLFELNDGETRPEPAAEPEGEETTEG